MSSSVKPIAKGSESTGFYEATFMKAPNAQLVACGNSVSTLAMEVSKRFPIRRENGSVEILLK